jgi:hypothetical protein
MSTAQGIIDEDSIQDFKQSSDLFSTCSDESLKTCKNLQVKFIWGSQVPGLQNWLNIFNKGEFLLISIVFPSQTSQAESKTPGFSEGLYILTQMLIENQFLSGFLHPNPDLNRSSVSLRVSINIKYSSFGRIV